MVKRTFYQVGNGLFAMEQTDGIVSVYDCGSTNQPTIDGAIDRVYANFQGEIDNLFISHFDKDHVNGIMKLLKTYKVKRVLLPMIPPLARIVNSSSVSETFQRDFILAPENYIRNISPETYIISVENSTNDNYQFNDRPRVNLNALANNERLTGEYQICVSGNWIYILYNRRMLLEAEIAAYLGKLGLQPNATNEDIIRVLQTKNVKLKKALEAIFTQQEIDSINEYSMIVWSGKADLSGEGCLYTGDYNTDKHYNELHKIYGIVKPATEIIQIPHHGSYPYFNDKLCSQEAFHVISAHPGPYKSRQIVDPNPVIIELQQKKFKTVDTRYNDVPL